MTITEFLLARIAEDEAAAQAASTGPWVWVGEAAEDSAFLYAGDNEPVIAAYGNHTEGYIECSDADRSYIARHDPARVLAECKAKRAILERAIEIHDMIDGEWGGGHEVSKEGWQDDNPGTEVVQALAAVYADHSEYRQEWAPA